jgi:hypothetical protein
MTDARTACAVVLFAACAASEMACSRSASPPPPLAQQAPAAPPPQAAALTQPAAAAPAGLGSAQYSANPQIRGDVLEVKRVSGNALLVRWRVVHAGTEPSVHYTFDWKDIYYIDPAENKKYGFLADSEGGRILDAKWGSMKPGEQWLSWAKFPAPPPTSTKISLSIGGFAPFEDLPVAP